MRSGSARLPSIGRDNRTWHCFCRGDGGSAERRASEVKSFIGVAMNRVIRMEGCLLSGIRFMVLIERH